MSLLKQAGDQELSGTPVARQTTETIRAQHAELLRQRQLLQAQQADRAALESELADSIRRYREMKGNTAQTAGTATAPTPSP